MDIYITAFVGLVVGILVGFCLRSKDDTNRLDFLAGTRSTVTFLREKSLWGVIDVIQHVSHHATLRGAIDKAERLQDERRN